MRLFFRKSKTAQAPPLPLLPFAVCYPHLTWDGWRVMPIFEERWLDRVEANLETGCGIKIPDGATITGIEFKMASPIEVKMARPASSFVRCPGCGVSNGATHRDGCVWIDGYTTAMRLTEKPAPEPATFEACSYCKRDITNKAHDRSCVIQAIRELGEIHNSIGLILENLEDGAAACVSNETKEMPS